MEVNHNQFDKRFASTPKATIIGPKIVWQTLKVVFRRRSGVQSDSGSASATAGCGGCCCLSCFGAKSGQSRKLQESPVPADKYEKEEETDPISRTVTKLEQSSIIQEVVVVEELVDNSSHYSQSPDLEQQQVCQLEHHQAEQLEQLEQLCHPRPTSTGYDAMKVSDKLTLGALLALLEPIVTRSYFINEHSSSDLWPKFKWDSILCCLRATIVLGVEVDNSY